MDRELIADRVGGDAREAFHHVQELAGSAEAPAVGEVRGLDDKRIPLPTTARIARKLTDVVGDMRTPTTRAVNLAWLIRPSFTARLSVTGWVDDLPRRLLFQTCHSQF